MAKSQHPTHDVVGEPQPGDGVEVSVDDMRQARNGRSSRDILWVLVISFVFALVAMGGYWATIAKDLDRADHSAGQPVASGQTVTDPSDVALFHAPVPAPKQPPVDAIRRSSTPSPTNVPLGTGEHANPGG